MVLAAIRDGFILDSWKLELIVRLAIAAGLGAVIGLEREQHGRPAGLRTHLLVALGAAVAMVVSLHFGRVYGQSGASIRVDPARVAYGVMAGIGFLGAGAIIRYGPGVRGLTTAASLWCTAAIGLGAGFGMFIVVLVATVIVLFALTVLDLVDRFIPTRITKTVTLTVPDISAETIKRYEVLLRARYIKVTNIGYACDFEKGRSTVTLRVSGRVVHLQEALDRLRQGAPEVVAIKVE